MNLDPAAAWLGILLLGALHGINPGMGWLFAVALGLQERSRRAVWGALLPLAAGHALAIAGAVIALGLIGLMVPMHLLKWCVAATLLGFGILKLFRARHPRFGGMRVGAADLTIWSLLMATAHGAGLMVLPFILGLRGTVDAAAGLRSSAAANPHAHHFVGTADPAVGAAEPLTNLLPLSAGTIPSDPLLGLSVAFVHTAGYLLITGFVAVVVYEKFGLRLLRSLWFNLDRIWAGALIATALLTPLV